MENISKAVPHFMGMKYVEVPSFPELLPWEIDNWQEESMSWKETCYVHAGISGNWFRVSGPDAQELLSYMAINNVFKWKIGSSKHLVFCDEQGYILNHKLTIREAEDSFRITLNGITVHEHTLAPIPHLTAVTTFDENSNTVITKLVNFSENEIELTFSYSADMAQAAEMTVLTAESRFAHNSFDTPDAVAPYTVTIPSSRNQVLPIRAHSVNVIMQKLLRS